MLVCHECFEREKSTNKEERKHQCEGGDKCFSNPNFAYFLIDVLSQDSLKLSPKGDGYLLCKPFQVPECPICHDEYSSTLEGKSPFCLWCNHTLCTSCYEKTRILYEGSNNVKIYQSICPICSLLTIILPNRLEGQWPAQWHSKLIDFLTELPGMTQQLEGMNITAYRFCKECQKEQPLDDMFSFEDCERKICGNCGFKKHRFHQTRVILQMKATKVSNHLQRISINEINTYKNLFLGLHNELVDDIGTFGTVFKLKTDFEAICEEYMPHLRECDTKVKGLIESLDDDTN